MRHALERWAADAEVRRSVDAYNLATEPQDLAYLDGRVMDFYFSLVGELFQSLRSAPSSQSAWAELGNAFALCGEVFEGTTKSDAWLFSAASFFNGGYSASAYLAANQAAPEDWTEDAYRACHDLLARPRSLTSRRVRDLTHALNEGSAAAIDQAVQMSRNAAQEALAQGPDPWVANRVYAALLERFSAVNVRAVLPDGFASRWDRLVRSLLRRRPPVWDFFPSQVEAIQRGLLTEVETYSLQMPTGAGKTALTETLIYSHLTDRPDDLAVLLVPYRALARELRSTLARRLSEMQLPARMVYGGTVPTPEEERDLAQVRVIVGTPEAFTGLISRVPELLARLTLAICDEGHLLDQQGRGIGLELLLARLRGRPLERRARFVFLSAVVPNIEEINSWLGGSDDTVVRSSFRPADAEYAVLRSTGTGRRRRVDLEMKPSSTLSESRRISDFLTASDFEFSNPITGRTNTHTFESVKSMAIATARKSLGLGAVAVFAATKTGNQGVVGLANELIDQVSKGLSPDPQDYVEDTETVETVADYLQREYGRDWIGVRALRAGAVVHHGDVPQETREALEELLSNNIRLIMCTRTLAEGINLPIRTLVLYAVRWRARQGPSERMLARDIRNLVGRAGRAGSSTKGLVICANEQEWADIEPVAQGQAGEPVNGALWALLNRVSERVRQGLTLTNTVLENSASTYPLVDGIDAALLELLGEEMDLDDVRSIATGLARQTFAFNKIAESDATILEGVFALRADRLLGLRQAGTLAWARDTGARPRLVDSVRSELLQATNWATIASPRDERLLRAVVSWAYKQRDFVKELSDAVRAEEPPAEGDFLELVRGWIEGRTFAERAADIDYSVDDLLKIHGAVVAHSLQTAAEQGLAILDRALQDIDVELAEPARRFPEYLRWGVDAPAALELLSGGVRHRRAALTLAAAPELSAADELVEDVRELAGRLILDEQRWRPLLGDFVYERTLTDVRAGGA